MKRRHELHRTGLESYWAGSFAGRREAWMTMARLAKQGKDGHLVPVYVGFARAAHHAYIKGVNRAVRYQQWDYGQPPTTYARKLIESVLGGAP